MWRLIMITFGFLGVAFYELSGGSDYAPSEGSRQHAAALEAAEPNPQTQPQPQRITALTIDNTQVGNARVLLAAAPAKRARADAPVSEAEKRLRLTLNTARQEPESVPATHGVATVAADPEKIAKLVAAAGAVRPMKPADPVETAIQSGDDLDLRKVSSNRVNMRQGPGTDFNVVGKLTRGATVEVLRDDGEGWVKLRAVDSGRVGWMADYLLVAAK